MKLRLLDLFSGIGGFSLGLERTGGFQTVAFCEIEPFCRRVLAKHWPEVPCYDDVRTLTAERLAADGIGVDVISGGFPCQDLSVAGKRAGIEASRSGLWSEITRLASELRPRFIIVENVANLLAGPGERRGWWFGRVLGDLAALGYDAEWHCIPASAVGLFHARERVWIVAYPVQSGWRDGDSPTQRQSEPRRAIANDDGLLAGKREVEASCGSRSPILQHVQIAAPTEPRVCRRTDGVPDWMDRVAALGNAVVPQIPELIGRAILAAEAA